MKILHLNTAYAEGYRLRSLTKFIKENGAGFFIRISLDALSLYRDYGYFVWDCVLVSMVAEKLHGLSKTLKMFEWETEGPYQNIPVVRFEVSSGDIEKQARLLFLSILYYAPEKAKKIKEYQIFSKRLSKHLKLIDQIELKFPEIVDELNSNLIGGAYGQFPEWARHDIKKHPERKFSFFKSAVLRMAGFEVFSTPDFTGVWFFKSEINPEAFLQKYLNVEKYRFEKASLYVIHDKSYLINNSYAVYFPMGGYQLARLCSEVCFDEFSWELPFNVMESWLTFTHWDRHLESDEYKAERHELAVGWGKKMDELKSFERPAPEYFLSEFGDVVLVKHLKYQFILWNSMKLNHNEKIQMVSLFAEAYGSVNKISGVSSAVNCSWEKLNDEKFEELCYDIIYHNPKFDRSTIRKMGKSRSRDGGRDIVVFTYSTLNKRPEKYIFQCKYIQPGGSLTTSKLSGISDVVEQYGAQGYGIMTSVVIDSTLYDRLDGIANNKKIKIETYSVFEIERLLALYSEIKSRYFT